jgi:hypothetical protein
VVDSAGKLVKKAGKAVAKKGAKSLAIDAAETLAEGILL